MKCTSMCDSLFAEQIGCKMNKVAPESELQHVEARHSILESRKPAAQFSAAELKISGFSAKELERSGLDFPTLEAAGYTPLQLKDAGFTASAFRSSGYEMAELKKLGFSSKELKEAGYDFSSLRNAGFDGRELKAAGFDSSAFVRDGWNVADLKSVGFTAHEIMYPGSGGPGKIESRYHEKIRELSERRVDSVTIFGETWLSFLAFFMPFGTKNSLWNRLKTNPVFYIFCYDSDFAKQLREKLLIEESPHPLIAVPNIDSAVNNCALICALLLNVPITIISNLTTSENLLQMMVNPFRFDQDRNQCIRSLDFSNLKNTTYNIRDCFSEFKENFSFVYISTIICFYSALYTLLTAVFYFMCRPAESSHNSSKIVLFEAYILEVRATMRKGMHSQSIESMKPPSEPFADPALEGQVLMRAKFYAENEAEEQKNLEFYIWYKSTFVAAVYYCLLLLLPLICGLAAVIAVPH